MQLLVQVVAPRMTLLARMDEPEPLLSRTVACTGLTAESAIKNKLLDTRSEL